MMEQPITVPVETDDDNSVYGPPRAEAILQLLRSWEEDDPQEQRETWEYLKVALDQDRLGRRQLFP